MVNGELRARFGRETESPQIEVPPPARGWSHRLVRPGRLQRGSPACAGMVRLAGRPGGPALRFPRLRGDGPSTRPLMSLIIWVPPPARGWSRAIRIGRHLDTGSPACAGMVRSRRSGRHSASRFPRLRGDGPSLGIPTAKAQAVPPPARGWSRLSGSTSRTPCGSPACAGMVPPEVYAVMLEVWFPRLRGDGPVPASDLVGVVGVPPPARGWSHGPRLGHGLRHGSPACAGMVLSGKGGVFS